MQIRLERKKLVIFVANVEDVLDDDLIRLLKKKNPSWTIKDCEEMAGMLRQFGFQIFDFLRQAIRGELNPDESQQKMQQELSQLRKQFEDFTKRKGISPK